MDQWCRRRQLIGSRPSKKWLWARGYWRETLPCSSRWQMGKITVASSIRYTSMSFKFLSRSNNIIEQFKIARRRRRGKRHLKLKRDHDPNLLWRYLLLSHLGFSKRPKLSSTECKTNFAIVKLISWRFRRFLDLPRISGIIGSLHDLITWSTFGKHENSSLLKNFVSTSWKSILKLGNLRIFSRISQK